ncbi:hypothetical protein CALVIDRAFT_225448 [Calocera viscosa TUFC12733]|uniref:Uncharacterized protein n=1 Tax=Calocera viscosa (strain TUFC12733) TaxID=1330018 RepID=A0A167K0M1_CALVF|nr:hypothetical protein CALVIDRAFT_225448 [Calocera viscosa TUFC12733]
MVWGERGKLRRARERRPFKGRGRVGRRPKLIAASHVTCAREQTESESASGSSRSRNRCGRCRPACAEAIASDLNPGGASKWLGHCGSSLEILVTSCLDAGHADLVVFLTVDLSLPPFASGEPPSAETMEDSLHPYGVRHGEDGWEHSYPFSAVSAASCHSLDIVADPFLPSALQHHALNYSAFGVNPNMLNGYHNHSSSHSHAYSHAYHQNHGPLAYYSPEDVKPQHYYVDSRTGQAFSSITSPSSSRSVHPPYAALTTFNEQVYASRRRERAAAAALAAEEEAFYKAAFQEMVCLPDDDEDEATEGTAGLSEGASSTTVENSPKSVLDHDDEVQGLRSALSRRSETTDRQLLIDKRSISAQTLPTPATTPAAASSHPDTSGDAPVVPVLASSLSGQRQAASLSAVSAGDHGMEALSSASSSHSTVLDVRRKGDDERSEPASSHAGDDNGWCSRIASFEPCSLVETEPQNSSAPSVKEEPISPIVIDKSLPLVIDLIGSTSAELGKHEDLIQKHGDLQREGHPVNGSDVVAVLGDVPAQREGRCEAELGGSAKEGQPGGAVHRGSRIDDIHAADEDDCPHRDERDEDDGAACKDEGKGAGDAIATEIEERFETPAPPPTRSAAVHDLPVVPPEQGESPTVLALDIPSPASQKRNEDRSATPEPSTTRAERAPTPPLPQDIPDQRSPSAPRRTRAASLHLSNGAPARRYSADSSGGYGEPAATSSSCEDSETSRLAMLAEVALVHLSPPDRVEESLSFELETVSDAKAGVSDKDLSLTLALIETEANMLASAAAFDASKPIVAETIAAPGVSEPTTPVVSVLPGSTPSSPLTPLSDEDDPLPTSEAAVEDHLAVPPPSSPLPSSQATNRSFQALFATLPSSSPSTARAAYFSDEESNDEALIDEEDDDESGTETPAEERTVFVDEGEASEVEEASPVALDIVELVDEEVPVTITEEAGLPAAEKVDLSGAQDAPSLALEETLLAASEDATLPPLEQASLPVLEEAPLPGLDEGHLRTDEETPLPHAEDVAVPSTEKLASSAAGEEHSTTEVEVLELVILEEDPVTDVSEIETIKALAPVDAGPSTAPQRDALPVHEPAPEVKRTRMILDYILMPPVPPEHRRRVARPVVAAGPSSKAIPSPALIAPVSNSPNPFLASSPLPINAKPVYPRILKRPRTSTSPVETPTRPKKRVRLASPPRRSPSPLPLPSPSPSLALVPSPRSSRRRGSSPIEHTTMRLRSNGPHDDMSFPTRHGPRTRNTLLPRPKKREGLSSPRISAPPLPAVPIRVPLTGSKRKHGSPPMVEPPSKRARSNGYQDEMRFPTIRDGPRTRNTLLPPPLPVKKEVEPIIIPRGLANGIIDLVDDGSEDELGVWEDVEITFVGRTLSSPARPPVKRASGISPLWRSAVQLPARRLYETSRRNKAPIEHRLVSDDDDDVDDDHGRDKRSDVAAKEAQDEAVEEASQESDRDPAPYPSRHGRGREVSRLPSRVGVSKTAERRPIRGSRGGRQPRSDWW